MDLLDFDGQAMYFDEPLTPEVESLVEEAAARYSEGPESSAAETGLLRAYFLEPEHLTVLVALYRFFYYRHRYRESLLVADRAIALVASRLSLPARWQDFSGADLGRAVTVSMTLTRFLLMALKGAGYLLMRLGEPGAALARFEKIAELDSGDRIGTRELAEMARAELTREAVARVAGNVTMIQGR
jgi:hypothetical protein